MVFKRLGALNSHPEARLLDNFGFVFFDSIAKMAGFYRHTQNYPPVWRGYRLLDICVRSAPKQPLKHKPIIYIFARKC